MLRRRPLRSITLTPQARRYTYEDLSGFPDDRLRRGDHRWRAGRAPAARREAPDGVLQIPSPLYLYAAEQGGLGLSAPMDVVLSDEDVVQPDALRSSQHMERVLVDYINGPPDVVVEISSPSTRRLELVHKRELYERCAVPEYWFMELDADRVEVYVHRDGVYGAPGMHFPGREAKSAVLAGFAIPVDAALAL